MRQLIFMFPFLITIISCAKSSSLNASDQTTKHPIILRVSNLLREIAEGDPGKLKLRVAFPLEVRSSQNQVAIQEENFMGEFEQLFSSDLRAFALKCSDKKNFSFADDHSSNDVRKKADIICSNSRGRCLVMNAFEFENTSSGAFFLVGINIGDRDFSGRDSGFSFSPWTLEEVNTDEKTFVAFYLNFIENLKLGKKDELAKVVNFPLLLNLPGQTRKILNSSEFIYAFDKIFPMKLRVRLQENRNFLVNQNGIGALRGKIWFGVDDGKVFVEAINNGDP